MAGEIVAGPKNERDNGFTERSVVLYFDLTTPTDQRIKDNDGNVVVVQSASQMPPWAAAKYTTGEKNAIDSGDAGFHQQTYWQSPGETASALLTRVRNSYPDLKSWFVNTHQTRYEDQGIQQDA